MHPLDGGLSIVINIAGPLPRRKVHPLLQLRTPAVRLHLEGVRLRDFYQTLFPSQIGTQPVNSVYKNVESLTSVGHDSPEPSWVVDFTLSCAKSMIERSDSPAYSCPDWVHLEPPFVQLSLIAER